MSTQAFSMNPEDYKRGGEVHYNDEDLIGSMVFYDDMTVGRVYRRVGGKQVGLLDPNLGRHLDYTHVNTLVYAILRK